MEINFSHLAEISKICYARNQNGQKLTNTVQNILEKTGK